MGVLPLWLVTAPAAAPTAAGSSTTAPRPDGAVPDDRLEHPDRAALPSHHVLHLVRLGVIRLVPLARSFHTYSLSCLLIILR